jgi:beta-lactam-binding protein with PASTA domain
MKRIFVITAAATVLHVDKRGQGRLTVTVSNTRERPVLTRAKVVAEDMASAPWLHLDADQAFTLPPLGSRQLALLASVPDSAAMGTYRCHVAVWAEDTPDEEYVTGPTVAVEVPSRPLVARRRFPWLLLILALALLAALAAPWWWGTQVTAGWQRRVVVPSLIGLPTDRATELLQPDLAFGAISQAQTSNRPLGCVIAQDPAPGTVVPLGSSVAVTVHGGILVPDLGGQWSEKARQIAAASQLVLGSITTAVEPSTQALGSVLRQQPAKHTPVVAGTAIDLVILGGVSVPQVTNTTLAFAQTAAKTLGLKLTVVTDSDGPRHREGIEKPTVIAQTPSSGTQVVSGSELKVTVAYPPVVGP